MHKTIGRQNGKFDTAHILLCRASDPPRARRRRRRPQTCVRRLPERAACRDGGAVLAGRVPTLKSADRCGGHCGISGAKAHRPKLGNQESPIGCEPGSELSSQ